MTFHRPDENITRVTSQVDVAPEGVVSRTRRGVIRRRAKNDLKRFKAYIRRRNRRLARPGCPAAT